MSEGPSLDELLDRLESLSSDEAKLLRSRIEGLQGDLRFSQDRVDQLSQELVSARKTVKDWEKRKNEMISVCAHDLKSPTSTILSFLDILRSEGRRLPADEVGEILSRIERAGRHMWSLVNNLLDSSQLDSGKMVVNKPPPPSSLRSVTRSWITLGLRPMPRRSLWIFR